MKKYEIQQRRADNLIWNGAASYGFKTDFRSFDNEGNASLYFNTVIGLIRRYYDYKILANIFSELTCREDSKIYAEILWLGLERLAWLKAKEERPVLSAMRHSYAREYLKNPAYTDHEVICNLKKCWFRRSLGEKPYETEWEKQVLDSLEFSPSLSTEQLKEQIEKFFSLYFRRTILGNLVPKNDDYRAKIRHKGMRYQKSWAVRHLGFVRDEDEAKEDGFSRIKQAFIGFGRPDAEKVHDYIESCFGKSILPETERIALEQLLCVKEHEGCYFHITKGEASDRCCEDAQFEQARFKEQQKKNREYYNQKIAKHRLAAQQLAQRIRNTLLLKEDDCGSHLHAGKLKSNIAWRAIAVDDSQVFTKPQGDLPDDLIVDILLDASTSQLQRQERLATQAYILSSALTKCDIPVRVLSYCSVSGCTVLRIYRDYYENSKNESIFDYTAAGWNRDGLALQALNWLLTQSGEGHRLVLILSDANPNDDQRMLVEGKFRYSREYTGKIAVEETAAKAANLRKGNRTVLCLYSGLDCNLENAKTIYNKDIVRIPDINTFAETVGKVLQIKLQSL